MHLVARLQYSAMYCLEASKYDSYSAYDMKVLIESILKTV